MLSLAGHSEPVQSVDQCLAKVCLLLVARASERQHWDEVVRFIQVVLSSELRLEESHISQLAECYLLAMLRTGDLSAAAALLEDEGPGGLRLSDSSPERLAVWAPLLQQLYDMATNARDPTRIQLREACTALVGLLNVKEKDVQRTVCLDDTGEYSQSVNEVIAVQRWFGESE